MRAGRDTPISVLQAKSTRTGMLKPLRYPASDVDCGMSLEHVSLAAKKSMDYWTGQEVD